MLVVECIEYYVCTYVCVCRNLDISRTTLLLKCSILDFYFFFFYFQRVSEVSEFVWTKVRNGGETPKKTREREREREFSSTCAPFSKTRPRERLWFPSFTALNSFLFWAETGVLPMSVGEAWEVEGEGTGVHTRRETGNQTRG